MIRYFVNHPTAANLLMVAIAVLGLAAAPNLQRDSFPELATTEVEVRIAYPGATPEDVEDAVCQRVEDALDVVSGLRELRCDARENVAIATAEMREGEDIDAFFNDVKSQVEAITGFPERVERPSVTKLERTRHVASIALTADMRDEDLKAYAEALKTRLKSDARIAQVRIQGFSDQNIVVEVPAAALHRHQLGVTDVQAAIERASLDLPAGTMSTPGGELIVRFKDQRRTPTEFADVVVVSSRTGGHVRLGDIASLGTEFDQAEQAVYFNGRRAALLEISKTRDQDSLRVMDAIVELLERERAIAPRGVQLEISADSTSNIRERLRILVSNGGQGLALVLLTMWAFFSLRFSFWVALGLPVSFLGAIFAMQWLGYSLNMMTMVALLVAIGILMDDAIVISENIAAHIRRGKSAAQAAVDGTLQVMPGVLSSFLTTAAIIGPLVLLSGKMGEILKYLPAVLLVTLVVSLVEAFLVLPAHLRHALAKRDITRQAGFQAWFDARFTAFRDRIFIGSLRRAIRQPYLVIATLVAVLLMSVATLPAGWLKFQAFPDLESDVIEARILLPQGTPLVRTQEVVADVVAALEALDTSFTPRQPEGQALVQNVTVRYNTHADAYESGPHLATVAADLLPAGTRDGTLLEMLAYWKQAAGEHPDVLSLKFTDRERGVAGRDIDLRLQGADLDRLKSASLELQAYLRGFDGVRDLSDDLRTGKPEVRIRLKETAGVFGLNGSMVANEVRAALRGSTALEVVGSSETYDVVVRLAGQDLAAIDDLHNLRIRTADGLRVPLAAVAEIELDRGFARIHRVNAQRTVSVQGALDTRIANAREITLATRNDFLPDLRARYPDIRISSQGQDKETAETGNSLLGNLVIGLVGIFLLLSFQFRNYLHPLVVMLAIPMGFIGVVWGHLVMGLALTMPSLVGFATLAGVVVNNNILLVGFVREQVAAGVRVSEAAVEAARQRFRPIMITSLTTVAGLLPLMLETSTQAQLLVPLVVSLAFGLVTATVSSLYLVPAFFAILDDLGFGRAPASADRVSGAAVGMQSRPVGNQ